MEDEHVYGYCDHGELNKVKLDSYHVMSIIIYLRVSEESNCNGKFSFSVRILFKNLPPQKAGLKF